MMGGGSFFEGRGRKRNDGKKREMMDRNQIKKNFARGGKCPMSEVWEIGGLGGGGK